MTTASGGQINNTIEDAVARARGELPHGESRDECESCGDPIPEARRKAIPGVRLCISCQQEKDLHNATFSGYNRRVQRQPVTLTFLYRNRQYHPFLYAHAFSVLRRRMCR